MYPLPMLYSFVFNNTYIYLFVCTDGRGLHEDPDTVSSKPVDANGSNAFSVSRCDPTVNCDITSDWPDIVLLNEDSIDIVPTSG